MLISLEQILGIAEARKIAIGSFNITSLEVAQSVLGAAEELNQPVILQSAPGHSNLIAVNEIGPILVLMAEKSHVPVCVHLDHGETLEDVHQALEMGFTSVMYDGSALSFEENVANTRAAVEMAWDYGASVEAEMGFMGREEFASAGEEVEGEAFSGVYTDPEQAKEFVEATQIDALACSFGTVHGIYMQEPCLDFDRIKAIKDKINKPIVMHGGSGVSDEDFKKCIANGVRKINYYTYLAKEAGEVVRDKCAKAKENLFYHDIMLWGMEAMKKNAKHAISVFSNLQ